MVHGFSDYLRSLRRSTKQILAVSLDVTLCFATVALAFWLRLNTWIYPTGMLWLAYLAAPAIAIPLFAYFGQYRAIFRYVGKATLLGTVGASVVYLLIYASIFAIIGILGVPRTIGIIQPILLLMSAIASRAAIRYWLGGGYSPPMRISECRRAIIFGAGAAGRQLDDALRNSDEIQIIGFVDDDISLQGGFLDGKRIFSAYDLPSLVERLGATDFMLAIPSATRRRRNDIIESLSGCPVVIRTIPGVADLASGRVKINELRELEIEDLLGRDSVAPDQTLLTKNITGNVILVTGAGGSIGSELCRQIVKYRPAQLLLVEVSEFNLYSVHQELEKILMGAQEHSVKLVPLLGSVLNENLMRHIVEKFHPDTIYHAAAYKHVPLVEHNPCEGLLNNVVGTLTLAKVANQAKVRDFVLVSTDKAVRPTNVMGATKRLAEQILQAMAAQGGATCFSMVRFGNVLGSSGSVVPLFRNQIRTGGPVTITHQEITRYFMTIPEASQLVIQAGAMATGGEVFVLDMGEPVKIIDLARTMIELSGLTERNEQHPDGDIAIEVVGLRPGEKLYEELLIGDNPQHTSHPLIMKAREKFLPWQQLSELLDQVRTAAMANDATAVRMLLLQLVPEFSPKDDNRPADIIRTIQPV